MVEAAIELIVTDGIHAVTQRKVAALAEVSLASTTYHFPSAEDLLVAAFEESARRSGEEFDTLASSAISGELSAVEAAVAFAGRSPFGVELGPDAILHLIIAAITVPRLRPAADAYVEHLAAGLAAVVDPPESASTLVRALTGLILHEMTRGRARPTQELRTDLTRLFAAFGVDVSLADVTLATGSPANAATPATPGDPVPDTNA